MEARQLTCRVICFVLIFTVFIFCCLAQRSEKQENEAVSEDSVYMYPTVMIAMLIRNKEHVLPFFFGHLETLNYPKDRIALWIRSDHNNDNTSAIIKTWIKAERHNYHWVDVEVDETSKAYNDERGPCDWTASRFDRVIELRQEALDTARKMWADFLFMLDADVVLEHKNILRIMISQEKAVIGPMLNSSEGGTYSNFWGGMTEKGYYQRIPEYFNMIERKHTGVYKVPMVHTALLINLRMTASKKFYYSPPEGYNGPVDDIIIFAKSVQAAGETMHLINSEFYGIVMVPLEYYNSLKDEMDHFTFIKQEAADAEFINETIKYPVKRSAFIKSPHIYIPEKPTDKMNFDEIYMINLVRRPARRERMLQVLKELGIDAKTVDAVDGKQLNDTYLNSLGVEMLPGYADPYHKRALTMGEIGCFLSHYFIWKEVVDKDYKRVLIFEDDVRFEPYFKTKLRLAIEDADQTVSNWDLIYLGRKRLNRKDESYVEGVESLVWPSYSYWTLSYALTNAGAKKLLQQNPLSKMIPVDEFLPIMFDRHPEDDWKNSFEPRNLVGLSTFPLLVYPTHYTGELNYISDTEDSTIIPVEGGKDKKSVKEREEL